MKFFLRALHAETLKLKRTLALHMVFVAPLVVVFVQFMFLLERTRNTQRPTANGWTVMANGALALWAILMLPLFVTLEAALVSSIEHSEKHWKHLYALPLPRWSIYGAKWTASACLIGASSLVLWLGTIGAGLALGLLRPDLGFSGPTPWILVFRTAMLMYLAAWLMISIHTWICVRTPSFALTSGTGIAATVAGGLIANSEKWSKFYPWSLQINIIAGNGRHAAFVLALGIVGGIVLAIAGCLETTRRDVI